MSQKQQIILIHGGDSFSEHADFLQYLKTVPLRDLPGSEAKSFWKRTLAEDLGDEYEVFLPSMPNSQNARYEEWEIWLERHLELVSDGVILIGWSLGGMFLAKYLSENTPSVDIKALYLLAAPSGEFTSDPKDGDCQDFTFALAAAATMAEKVPEIMIWHSEDDFVVPAAETNWDKNHLPTAKITIFKDKNHFLVPELPELIDSIHNL